MIIYVDIDDTICYYTDKDKDSKDYTKAEPDFNRINIVNSLYDKGHTIIMWTARGTVTKICWLQTTTEQLKLWGVKFTELKFGKPAFDLLIDDKALTNLEQLNLDDF